MIEAAIVTLRESAELLLIGQAAMLSCRQAGRVPLKRAYFAGTLAGVAIGVAASCWVVTQAADKRLAAGLSVAFLAVVIVLASTLLSTTRLIRDRTQDLAERWRVHLRTPAVMLGLAAVVALREALETGLLLAAIDPGFDTATIAGAAAGLGVTALLVLGYDRIKDRIPLPLLFRGSAAVLVCIAMESLFSVGAEWLHLHASADSTWLHALEPVLPGGPGHAWTCALLMAVPLALMLRRWWSDTADH